MIVQNIYALRILFPVLGFVRLLQSPGQKAVTAAATAAAAAAAAAAVAAEEIAIAAIVFLPAECPSSFVLYEQNSLTLDCNELRAISTKES
ncbi:hypothetical protein P5V15_005534 [Pogonomyrmex californicus]